MSRRPPAAPPDPQPTDRPAAGVAMPPAGRGLPRVAALCALVAGALALRLGHAATGLPDFVEEAIPFRRALAMWGWESGRPDWNPRFFHYPSLSLYLHHLLQQAHVAWGIASGAFANAHDYHLSFRMDPTPMVVAARALGMAADAATVAGVAVLGERLRRGAGWVAAALVACAPAMVLTSRAIQADPLMTALAVWGLERALAWRERGGRGRLAAAAVLIGLAAGTKYTAVTLALPLAWVVVERRRGRALATLAVAGALVVATAIATTPFALVEWPTFLRDLAFVRGLPEGGHLGNLERRAFLFHLGHLGRDLGWAAVALLALSPFALLRRGAERGAWAALGLALAGFALPISLARIEAERYLVPVVPLAALLIGGAAVALASRLGRGRWRPLRAALPIAIVLPAILAGARAAATGGDTTQLEARRWCEAHLGGDELLLQEAYGVNLPGREALERAASERSVREASPAVRARFLARRGYRVVTLPLSVAGRCVSRVPVPGAAPVEVEIFPHPADFNRVFYDPRLLVGVDYLLTSDAVRGRYQADPARFADAVAFYRWLDAHAAVAARFPARAGVAGPTVTIYRLDARTDSLLLARHGPLDPLWWTARIPAAYRARVETLLGARAPAGDALPADGGPPAWVGSLSGVFEEKVHRFGSRMADELTSLGRCGPATAFAEANLMMSPADLDDCLAFTACAGRLGEWTRGRRAVERALEASTPGTPAVPYLRLERARILFRVGERALAREELERVLDDAAADEAVTEAARRGLEPS